jgi:hypothetical protein
LGQPDISQERAQHLEVALALLREPTTSASSSGPKEENLKRVQSRALRLTPPGGAHRFERQVCTPGSHQFLQICTLVFAEKLEFCTLLWQAFGDPLNKP